MKQFEIIPHTADVRLLVSGADLRELLEAAIAGMAEILWPGLCLKKRSGYDVVKTIALSAVDRTALLVDFLSEILTLSHEEYAVFCEARFQSFSETKLEAAIYGVAVPEFSEDIKAVTYHEAEVKRNDKRVWETVIVFDV